MARPRQFDDQAALNAAMECFWQHGFDETSMRELVASTGLSAPSLYNAFGDKRALFEKALRNYIDQRTDQRLTRLEALGPRAAIETFFAESLSMATSKEGQRGCFLVNSVMDVQAEDAALAAILRAAFARYEDFFRRKIEAGLQGGDIAPGTAPQAGARALIGLFLGLRVAARFRPEQAFLEDMVRPMLAALFAGPPTDGSTQKETHA